MVLTHLSLFSGIGGIDLAAEWAGFKTICFVEIDKYCQKVLRKHWPDVPIIEDVKDVTKEKIMAYTRRIRQAKYEKQATGIEQCGEAVANTRCEYDEGQLFKREHTEAFKEGATFTSQRPNLTPRHRGATITLVTGGFPCQPHSVAGQHKGSADERNLWPEFRRVIGEIRPRWVLAENVPGLFSTDAGRFFGEMVKDLAEMGYSAGWCTYGAVDVGALHRRNRVFIVANSSDNGLNSHDKRSFYKGQFNKNREQSGCGRSGRIEGCSQDVADTANTKTPRQRKDGGEIYRKPESRRFDQCRSEEWWAVEPDVGRVAHGIPSRVDRLKSLGNAVVPQQIFPILKAIADIESGLNK